MGRTYLSFLDFIKGCGGFFFWGGGGGWGWLWGGWSITQF